MLTQPQPLNYLTPPIPSLLPINPRLHNPNPTGILNGVGNHPEITRGNNNNNCTTKSDINGKHSLREHQNNNTNISNKNNGNSLCLEIKSAFQTVKPKVFSESLQLSPENHLNNSSNKATTTTKIPTSTVTSSAPKGVWRPY